MKTCIPIIKFKYFNLSLLYTHMDTAYWPILGLLFLCVFLVNKKTLNFVGDHPMYIPTKFGTNRLSGFKDKD